MTQAGDGGPISSKGLFCPRDGSGMATSRTGECTLDVCAKCNGQFFDQGEMFAAFGLKADPSYWDRPETAGALRDGAVRCPRCKAAMSAQDVSHGGRHVEVDRCRACGGIWLDGGEVEAIMAIGESVAPVVEAERTKAREGLPSLEEMEASSVGLIGRFLRLFFKR